MGTLFLLINAMEQYDIDDIILCEYGTTVVGPGDASDAVRKRNAEENRKVAAIKSHYFIVSSP